MHLRSLSQSFTCSQTLHEIMNVCCGAHLAIVAVRPLNNSVAEAKVVCRVSAAVPQQRVTLLVIVPSKLILLAAMIAMMTFRFQKARAGV